MRCRFVQPDIVRLTLSDGDSIDVKTELNAGEQRKLFADMVKEMHPGEKVLIEPQLVGLTKLVAYLVGWSFVDQDGKPVPVSEAAINNLDTDTFREVTAAIDAHEEQQSTKRETARKNHTGATGSKAISVSVAPLDGDINGSVTSPQTSMTS